MGKASRATLSSRKRINCPSSSLSVGIYCSAVLKYIIPHFCCAWIVRRDGFAFPSLVRCGIRACYLHVREVSDDRAYCQDQLARLAEHPGSRAFSHRRLKASPILKT